MNPQKTLLSLALAGALGASATTNAETLAISWTGAFTMLNTSGIFTANTDTNNCYAGMTVNPTTCLRTAISGTATFDTITGAGTGTVAPFSFFGGGLMINSSLSLQAIGNGAGGPGALVLGNMTFYWNGGNGIPLSIVWDATGFFDAVNGGLSVGQTVTGGALPASNNTEFDSDGMAGGTTYPIGPAVMATTAWNTTTVAGVALGSNPSGTLPLLSDTVVDATNGDLGVGGSPMPVGKFKNFNANYDILSMQVTNIEAVPLPATVWLFGSGLAGLVSLARRRRTAYSTPSRME